MDRSARTPRLFAPLAALFEGVRHATKLTVALTFDDGYESFAALALPILERHRVPATLFVTAIRAAGEDVLWPDLLDVSAHLTDAPLVVAGERFVKDRRREWRSERDGTPLKERGRRGDGKFVAELSAALRRVADVPSREDLALYWRTLSEGQLRAVAASPLVTVGSRISSVRPGELTGIAAQIAASSASPAPSTVDSVKKCVSAPMLPATLLPRRTMPSGVPFSISVNCLPTGTSTTQ